VADEGEIFGLKTLLVFWMRRRRRLSFLCRTLSVFEPIIIEFGGLATAEEVTGLFRNRKLFPLMV
jgi:hypothetical protein